MRSRESVFHHLNIIAKEERLLVLSALTELDARLLRVMIPCISYDQVYYPAGAKIQLNLDGILYEVSCDQDLLIVSRAPIKLHVIECIENTGDLIHYRYLGQFDDVDNRLQLIPSRGLPEQYFIDFDAEQSRSALFQSVVKDWLDAYPVSLGCYKQGDVALFQRNGLDYQLHIKTQGMIYLRPSESKKQINQTNQKVCMEMVGVKTVGKGFYGLVSAASTYRFIADELQESDKARVTKAIQKRVSSSGEKESVERFRVRVFREHFFGKAFGLKPKWPIFDWSNQQAHLTMREVPGVTLLTWITEALRGGRFIPADRAYRVSLACLKVLAALHAKQVIHGDLKSNNIMIHERPDGEVLAQLIDAGAASSVNERVPFCAHRLYVCPESADEMKGKPGYVPLNSQAADVYALGVDLAYLWGFHSSKYDERGNYDTSVVERKPRHVDDLSEHELKDLREWMKGLLNVSPSYRYTASRAATQLSGYFNSRLKASDLDRSGSPERRHLK